MRRMGRLLAEVILPGVFRFWGEVGKFGSGFQGVRNGRSGGSLEGGKEMGGFGYCGMYREMNKDGVEDEGR